MIMGLPPWWFRTARVLARRDLVVASVTVMFYIRSHYSEFFSRRSMAHNSFGGAYTGTKLQTIESYLHAYTHVLKNRSFETVFVDAFAGTGAVMSADNRESFFEVEEADRLMVGSAARALRLKVPFHRYIFVERAARKTEELERLKADHPALATRIEIRRMDANDAIADFCKSTDWRRTRAVVFLDPFGNQVEWRTIERIALTKAIDLWYLFPAGLGVARQIALSGKVLDEHAASLDRLLGTPEWRVHFLKPVTTPDLFEGEVKGFERRVTADSVTSFLVERMSKIFEGGVLSKWLPLGPGARHDYSLVFACANPSPAANEKALRIARSVMEKGASSGRRK
ncbi:MAG TPA: three-Cys-motif partner protein TcmP [Beijerinckiaceae bacterium]|jgi:three-Cys-motif partner protein